MEGFGKPETMRQTIHLALIPALAVLALPGTAVAATGGLNDFRLPQGGSQAQPEPQRQGPVAPDVPESQIPRATPTPAPAPVATTAPTPSAAATRPVGTASPRPAIILPTPARSAAPVPAATATVPAAAETPAATVIEDTVPPGAAAPPAPRLPQPLPAPSVAADDGRTGWLPWAVGAAALLAALALGWLAMRRRVGPSRQQAVPVVERPRPAPVTPDRAAEPVPLPRAPAAAVPPRDPLEVTLVPVRMSLTLVNAVLNWEVELANQGNATLDGLAIAADMISAHADLSPQDRTSGPAVGAQSVAVGPLAPGERRIAGGEIRLPFPHIVPIWHGEIALLMPLLRLRISAEGILPLTRIFLVGQPSPADPATLQPFRLDLGPRVYPDLAQRAFA